MFTRSHGFTTDQIAYRIAPSLMTFNDSGCLVIINYTVSHKKEPTYFSM